MKAAIYCRVSTDDQQQDGTSLESQMEACLAHCSNKGYQVVKRFKETYSGLTIDRPKLNELRALINANEIDIVVIYCLDRLSRDQKHGFILRYEIDEHGVKLESVKDDIDKSPLGEAITFLRDTFAQIEADKIRERTIRGKKQRIKQGRLPQGAGKGIYGYDWDKETGHRKINEHESKIVRGIFNDVIQGNSFNKIAVNLNNKSIKSKAGTLWHPLTVRRMVRNVTYTGITYYGRTKRISKTKVILRPEEEWTQIPGVTPQIITKEIFDLAQEAISKSKEKRPIKHNAAYLFTGFAKCPKCGSPLGGTMLNGKYRYYQCRGARPTATRGKICGEGYIKADKLESAVWFKLLELSTSPLALLKTENQSKEVTKSEYVEQLSKQIEGLRKKMKSYPQKERNLYELLNHDTVTKDYVIEAVTKLKTELSNDENELKSIISLRKEANGKKSINVSLTEASGRKYSELIDEFNPEMRLYRTSKDSKEELLAKKRAFLASLNFKLVADQQSFSFSFNLNGSVISSKDEKEYSEYEDSLESAETEPLISVEANDEARAQFIDETKRRYLIERLVTIVRTSG